jgi:hypothetical protein
MHTFLASTSASTYVSKSCKKAAESAEVLLHGACKLHMGRAYLLANSTALVPDETAMSRAMGAFCLGVLLIVLQTLAGNSDRYLGKDRATSAEVQHSMVF